LYLVLNAPLSWYRLGRQHPLILVLEDFDRIVLDGSRGCKQFAYFDCHGVMTVGERGLEDSNHYALQSDDLDMKLFATDSCREFLDHLLDLHDEDG
jgi:hypothetical protein